MLHRTQQLRIEPRQERQSLGNLTIHPLWRFLLKGLNKRENWVRDNPVRTALYLRPRTPIPAIAKTDSESHVISLPNDLHDLHVVFRADHSDELRSWLVIR